MFAFRKRLFAYVEASYFTENWYRKVKFENAYSCDVRYVTQSKNYFKYEDMVRSLKTKVFLIEKRLNFFICQLILLGSAYCRHCFISKLKKCLQTVRYVTENGPKSYDLTNYIYVNRVPGLHIHTLKLIRSAD